MNFPPRARVGCITQQHRVSTEPSQMETANPDPLPHSTQRRSMPHPGAQRGPLLPQDFITPILRAHISADSLPHPNPQLTLALRPVPSPRQKQSHQLLALEILRALNILCQGCRWDGLWISLDKPEVTELDLPHGPFHFYIPISPQTAQSLPGRTHTEGTGFT